jgi:hypothetical protein
MQKRSARQPRASPEGATNDVLVGDVTDLLEDAAPDGVADLFGGRLGMDVLRTGMVSNGAETQKTAKLTPR